MPSKPKTFLFRVSLAPDIWREIEITGSSSLYTLARMINKAFGFGFDHCFGFFSNLKGNYQRSEERYELFNNIGEDVPGSLGVKRTRIATAFPEIGKKMLFLFDYGDEWLFTVGRIANAAPRDGSRLPRVVRSHGKAPPQYPGEDDEYEHPVH